MVSDHFAFGGGVLVLSGWIRRDGIESLSGGRMLVKRSKSLQFGALGVSRSVRCK